MRINLTLFSIILVVAAMSISAIGCKQNGVTSTGEPNPGNVTGNETIAPTTNNSIPDDRGPVFAAVEVTLAEGGPVKEDLIKRGLFTVPSTYPTIPGVIQVNAIEKLVKSKIYVIGIDGSLQFGPEYAPP